MQTLYYYELDKSQDVAKIWQVFNRNLSLVHQCYLFKWQLIRDICNYAWIDAERQANRLLKTSENSLLPTKILEHPVILYLNSPKAKDTFEKNNIESLDNEAFIKPLFNKLKNDEIYKAYQENTQSPKEKIEFINYIIFEFLMNDPFYEQQIENMFPNWVDDDEIILKQIQIDLQNAANPNFALSTLPIALANQLCKPIIKSYIDNNDTLKELIKPYLVKWEADRLALMDFILMRMTLTEWLYCPEIPVKVSLNEYLDIAKWYSGPKSKDFINGCLDKCLQNLKNTHQIRKTGAGLKEK